jgi:hypothetical protein
MARRQALTHSGVTTYAPSPPQPENGVARVTIGEECPGCHTAGRQARQIDQLRTRFAPADGLPFADVLPAKQLEQALPLEDAVWRGVVYAPRLTWWTFFGRGGRRDSGATARLLMLALGAQNAKSGVRFLPSWCL